MYQYDERMPLEFVHAARGDLEHDWAGIFSKSEHVSMVNVAECVHIIFFINVCLYYVFIMLDLLQYFRAVAAASIRIILGRYG